MNLYFILILSIFAIQAKASSPAPEPQKIVEEIFQKASTEAVVQNPAIQADINQRINFSAMGLSVLGKEAKKINATELQWFQNTLKEIITRTVYPEAPTFLRDVKIEYAAAAVTGSKAKVDSLVKNKADTTEVSYTLELNESGKWQVVDISLDGESWVVQIRDQVAVTLKKKQWKGLKELLNQRLASLKK